METDHKLYPQLAKPFGAFCHAVRANGFLFLSGFTASNTPAQNGDIVEQTEAILDQIKSILDAEGAAFKDVVKVTVYVTDLDKLQEVHDVRFRYFGDTLPASTLVQVSALVRPELKIEIEAVVALPS